MGVTIEQAHVYCDHCNEAHQGIIIAFEDLNGGIISTQLCLEDAEYIAEEIMKITKREVTT